MCLLQQVVLVEEEPRIIFFASDFEEYVGLKVFNHDKVRYGCRKCRKTYQQKKTLGRHLRFDCGQKPAFVCQLCSKAFKHGYILLKHMRNTHDIYIQKLRQRHASQSSAKSESQVIKSEAVSGVGFEHGIFGSTNVQI
ncbi:hypothetical protein GWI33_014895 [Rhynchophorus ferrugineus]|uniref:C2H2-type domain-containing protein n=1 Tax=Rhynchophorus ferrugineus TaxID=354439 RepID=A0A834I4B6_RHYFE|nr:hypothetical protein GWI33_014895 [Rhynchophorus ferrugineus]